MLSPINLEAEVHLVDLTSERIPPPARAVTLVIRQGIEVLVKGSAGQPEAIVFIEFSEGQVRASVWDVFSDPVADPPTVHLLQDVKEQCA